MKSILYKIIKNEESKKFKIEKFSFEDFVVSQIKKHKEEEKLEELEEKEKKEERADSSLTSDDLTPAVEEEKIGIDEAEKEKIIKRAYDEGLERGYREGFEKGLKEAEEKVNSMVEEYKKSLEKLNTLREKIYEEAQSEMILIVKEALKKIVAAEIKSSEEFILNVIKETIKNVVDTKKIVVKVSPEDYKYLSENKEKLNSLVSGKEIELVEDPAITRGGCIIQTDMGEIDSTVETKLEEVLNILEEKNE